MSTVDVVLRPYRAEDEEAAIELWRLAWAQAYPMIDFAARLGWWRDRWRSELLPVSAVVVAERRGDLLGFVTVDCANGYMDQIAVAPAHWGSGIAGALLDEARRLSPPPLHLRVNTDNARAIRFYEKHGFSIVGEDVNPHSGRPVYAMRA